MAMIKVDSELCKGCLLCKVACPKNILEAGDKTNKKGYRYLTLTDESQCIGCRFCAMSCPDAAITVYK